MFCGVMLETRVPLVAWLSRLQLDVASMHESSSAWRCAASVVLVLLAESLSSLVDFAGAHKLILWLLLLLLLLSLLLLLLLSLVLTRSAGSSLAWRCLP